MSTEATSTEPGSPRESSFDLFGLRLYALFLISSGVASVGAMIQGAFQNSFRFDLGFLGILIGRGLLMRKASERAWAVFVVWCGIISVPLVGVLYAFSGGEPELILGLEPPGQTIVFSVYVYGVAIFAFSLWMRKILAKEAVRETFSDEGKASDGWWLVFLVIAALNTGTFLVVTSVHERVVDRTFDQLEYHEAIVEVVDPGMGLLSPTVSMTSSSADRRKLPKISTAFCRDKFGITRLRFSWISTGPVEVSVAADGYVPKDVRLTGRNDGETIRVELVREKKASDSVALDDEDQNSKPQP